MHEKKYGFSPFFYRNGLTFSVTSRDCAISQLTFSHGIVHNFGGIGNGGKTKKEITYIAFRKEIMRTNANLIYQIITKTTTGKFGMPSNDKHFSRNIATIAGLGDESCICYEKYYMKAEYKRRHMWLKESCKFQSSHEMKPGIPLDKYLPFPKTPKPNFYFTRKPKKPKKPKKSEISKKPKQQPKNKIETRQQKESDSSFIARII